MQSTYVQIMLDRQREEQRRWERYKRQRLRPPRITTLGDKIKDFLRWLAAFLFTQVGVCALVVGYTIVGAFVFSAIEEERGLQQVREVKKLRSDCVQKLWNVTLHLNILHKPQWEREVDDLVVEFQGSIVTAIKRGYDGKADPRWTFPAALMYSLTVYTTIGYGNITPKTAGGKIATILYALVGIPLMLLYMTNVGDILGSSFKYLYSKYNKLCRCQQPAGGKSRKDPLQSAAGPRRKRSTSAANRSPGKATPSPSNVAVPATVSSPVPVGGNEATRMEDGSSMTKKSSSQLREEERVERAKFLARHRPVLVPTTACLLVMFSYVVVGALVFSSWEKWGFVDGSYFCFVSLLTIGFGDLVPGQAVKEYTDNTSQSKLIVCAFYLLVGMSLIAMCFNLMQEEAIHNIRNLAGKIGLLRSRRR